MSGAALVRILRTLRTTRRLQRSSLGLPLAPSSVVFRQVPLPAPDRGSFFKSSSVNADSPKHVLWLSSTSSILNNTPSDFAEKQVLKQTILVAPYETFPLILPQILRGQRECKGKLKQLRISTTPNPPCQSGDLLMSAPSSVHRYPGSLCLRSVRVVFLYDPHYPSIRSLDHFLSRHTVNADEVEYAEQYIPGSSTSWEQIEQPHLDPGEDTVLDLVLLGGLDPVSGNSWIRSGQGIRFPPTSIPPSVPPSPPPVLPTHVRSPSRTTSVSHQPINPVLDRPTSVKSPTAARQTRPRRSDKVMVEYPRPVPERGRRTLSPHSDFIWHPYAQGSCNEPSPNAPSSGRASQRFKLDLIRKPNDQIDSASCFCLHPFGF